MSYGSFDIDDNLQALAAENEQLKSQLMTTSLINELSKVLHSKSDTASVYQTLLLGIHEIAGFDRCIFFTIDKDTFCLEAKAFFNVETTPSQKWSIPLGFEGGEITDALFLNRHFIINDPIPGEDFFQTKLNSRSYCVFPIMGRMIPTFKSSTQGEDEETILLKEPPKEAQPQTITENERRRHVVASRDFQGQGVVWVDRNESIEPLSSEDISTISSILTQAGIIIQNILMNIELEKTHGNLQIANDALKIALNNLNRSHDKLNKDLEHARVIQQGLLPQKMPKTTTMTTHSVYIPADAVGGDYFDVFEIKPGIFGIIIADVSGHGVSSALIMSMVKALLKTFAETHDGPQKTLERINTIFQSQIKTTNFVTVFYATIDTNTNTFTYTSAGHCPTLLIDKKNQMMKKLKADGLFLGVFPDMMLHETRIPFEPHSNRIILYTDGLTEAMNSHDVMFDIGRLCQVAQETLTESPEIACNRIINAQKKFCGTFSEPADDVTLLVVDF